MMGGHLSAKNSNDLYIAEYLQYKIRTRSLQLPIKSIFLLAYILRPYIMCNKAHVISLRVFLFYFIMRAWCS